MNAKIFSVGYVPQSFPRDPAEVSQYDEHVILGQIYEPLVDADGDGNLAPSIAKEWHFSKDGKEIEFLIDTKIKFSNGKAVTVEDVVYSISRHLNVESQSKHFLADVSEIKAVHSDRVKILLKKENVSILKALTRDQLGIMPKGWTFDRGSERPYVGTGPYNLIRKNGEWFLESNPEFKRLAVSIKAWKLLFYRDSSFNIPDEIPDVAPDVTAGTIEQIKKNSKFSLNKYSVINRLGFSQTSFWVHPKGSLYSNPGHRKFALSFLNDIINDYCGEYDLKRSTGMIPVGIQGSLARIPPIEKFKKNSDLKHIKIAALAGTFSKIFSADQVKKIKEKYNISLDVTFFTSLEIFKIQEINPDIITGSWAGGFSDPSGFLALLNRYLGSDFKAYLGKKGEILAQAEAEQNYSKRTDLFRLLGESVITDGLMIPGWRTFTFEVISSEIKTKIFQARYTPRLLNFIAAD